MNWKTTNSPDTGAWASVPMVHGHGPVMLVNFSRVENYLAIKGRATVWNYTNLETEPE